MVGEALSDRREELLTELTEQRENKHLALYALMITDFIEKGTTMLVAGDVGTVARSFGVDASDSTIELPGVMSRKKEVAPTLMTALLPGGAAARRCPRSGSAQASTVTGDSLVTGASPHSCSSR